MIKGSTSNSLVFNLKNTSNANATGLTITALKLQFIRSGSDPSTATSLTALSTASDSFTEYAAIELDATNSPGLYRIDCPNDAFLTGSKEVTISITGTGINPCYRQFDLIDDIYGLFTNGTGILSIKRFNIVNNTSDPTFNVTNTTGDALLIDSNGKGTIFGQSTGRGMYIYGAGSSSALEIDSYTGPAVQLTSASGDGIRILPTNGNAIRLVADGTNKHDIYLNGSGDIFGDLDIDKGTVSASPSPTTTTFTATGSFNTTVGGYSVAPMCVFFKDGPNKGFKFPISIHTVSGSDHAFTVSTMPNAPTSGNKIAIV